VLIEDLIRLGHPLLKSPEFAPEDILRLVTGVEDERVINFYRHVFVVEVPVEEGDAPRALPMQAFGEAVRENGKEVFQVEHARAVGLPFLLPSGGNPLQSQGRYLPVYPCWDPHLKRFRESAQGVKEFLAGRLERTVGFWLSERMNDAVAATVHEALRETDFGDEKKILGILVLARCEPGGYFALEAGRSRRRIGISVDGSSIVPNFAKLLDGYWTAKLEEGREAGSRVGSCSFSGSQAELVSAYCKAWPWAFPTWSCPLPNGGDNAMLIETVGLSPETYEALTLGASIFNRLASRVSSLVTPELFSPADCRPGKEQVKRHQDQTVIHGSGFLLPLQDRALDCERSREDYVGGVRSMLKADPQDPTMADRYMTAVTGFDIMLPPDTTDEYRLTLVYFSGEFSRGDVHLRACIQDVIPSTLTHLRDLARAEGKRSLHLLELVMPGMSEKQSAYLGRCYASLPYLLVRAYGGAYLWQQLAALLHRQRLDARRVTANAAARMQSLVPRWPEARYELFEEVGFYLSFLSTLGRANTELAGSREEPIMRPWKELLDLIDNKPVAELQLTDASEVGFACGALVKRFGMAYFKAMKPTKANPDFLRDRVLNFGTDLRVQAVHDKGLRLILELPNRLKSLKRNRDLEERTGAVMNAFQQSREDIDKRKEMFLTAFWSGYALEGHNRLTKPKTCPHCGKPLTQSAKAGA
jgi:hypothetical protein